MTPKLPEHSLIQRRIALRKGNDVRIKRSQLKKDLKAGKISLYDLLLEPPDYICTAKVFDIMLAAPKYGRVKVGKVLKKCRVSPMQTVEGMSLRQRTELISMLRK